MKKKAAAQPEGEDSNREAILSLYNDMETGLNTLSRGVKKMQSFFDNQDEQILDEGFDVIVAGATLMIDTQNKVSAAR